MPTAQRILIIRPSALGDVARTVPCLVALRRAYPGATIDWLVDSRFVDAVRDHPALNGVMPFERHRLAAVWPLLRRLRGAKYDLVFDLQGLARSGLFAWATRAAVRVGYANARELGWLGTNRRHRIERSVHAMERMLGLLEAEGIEPAGALTLHVPEDDRGWAEAHFAERQLRGERYACVAPTARWGCKCWPPRKYAELTRRLLGHSKIDEVFVLATPAEMPGIAEAFRETLPADLLGRICFAPTTVGQMMDVIARATLLVGNDSAPLHLAVGLGTPTVSLFGPTDPAVVGPPPAIENPLNPAGHRVIRAPSIAGQTENYRRHRDDDSLIAEIELDTVWRAVQETLG